MESDSIQEHTMSSNPGYTHKGTVKKPRLGWAWTEKLRETSRYWMSYQHSETGKVVKYRKTDGTAGGGDDYLDLESIKEI